MYSNNNNNNISTYYYILYNIIILPKISYIWSENFVFPLLPEYEKIVNSSSEKSLVIILLTIALKFFPPMYNMLVD